MSLITDDPLPDNIEQLKQLVLSQQKLLLKKEEQLHHQVEQLSERDELIAQLKERLALLLSKRYQHSSEKLDANQLKLFDETELELEIAAIEKELQAASDQKTTSKPKASKPTRKPLPDSLRRVEIIVDVSDEEKARMGDDWELVGYDDSEQLAVHEREYYVKHYKRCKYVRKQGVPEENEYDIKVAQPAPVILPKALVDASVLAKIITGKFIDAMSFYREHKVLEREGIEIGYSTLCSYPIQLYERLELFRQIFYEEIAHAKRWHLDETTLQVLNEVNREARDKSHMWCNRAIFDHGELVLFHYHPRRHYEALEQWLAPALPAFSGVIVSDEHKPYAKLADEYEHIAARGGCWSHARRKFADAVKGRRHGSDAHCIMKLIATLFKLDKKTHHLTGDALLEQRQKLIQPWCDEFKSLIDKMAPDYPDKGLMKTAIGYVQNNWESLTAFMNHADLVITNNPVENSIRPFTIGRKNWMFSGGPRGADASAFMYTLVESAKANGLEPKRYLTMLFEQFPLATNREQIRELLPHIFKFN